MTAIRIVEIQDINVETNFSQKGSINNAATSPPDTIEESTILHIVNLFDLNHKVIFDYLFKSSYMPV